MLVRNRKRINFIFAGFLLFVIIGTFVLNMYLKNIDYHETQFLFKTEVYVEAHGWGARAAATEALSVMSEVSRNLTMYAPDSELSRINEGAGIQPVEVSKATFDAIEEALRVAKLSEGAFDPTVGPLVRLWGIGENSQHNPIPSPEQIKSILKLVDYQKVILDPLKNTVYLPQKGMQLDLGAISKGYGVKQAIKVLKEHKITSALVSAGGNNYAIGTKLNGEPWRIGIRNPRENEKTIGSIELVNQAIDTSGDYERYFMENGKRYSHILDPHTGYPTEGVESSTVIVDDPSLADALATVVYILGPERGMNFISQIPNAMAVVITSDGKLHNSPGFERKLIK